MTNTYYPDHHWKHLAHDLVAAATDPADPLSAVKEIMASAGIMPLSCREDCEGVAASITLSLDNLSDAEKTETVEQLRSVQKSDPLTILLHDGTLLKIANREKKT